MNSSTVEDKIFLVVTYLFGWVSGLIMLLTQRKNYFLRFHGAQSILISIVPTILWFVSWLLSPLQGIASVWALPFKMIAHLFGGLWGLSCLMWVILAIVCIVQSWNGDTYKMLFFGDKAEALADRVAQ